MTPEAILSIILKHYGITRDVLFLPCRWNGGIKNTIVSSKYPSYVFISDRKPMERTPKITDARAIFVNMMYRVGYTTREISDFFLENNLKRTYVSIRHLRDLVDDKRKQDGEFADLFNDIYTDVKALDYPPKL